jgi:hypothetical protein
VLTDENKYRDIAVLDDYGMPSDNPIVTKEHDGHINQFTDDMYDGGYYVYADKTLGIYYKNKTSDAKGNPYIIDKIIYYADGGILDKTTMAKYIFITADNKLVYTVKDYETKAKVYGNGKKVSKIESKGAQIIIAFDDDSKMYLDKENKNLQIKNMSDLINHAFNKFE